MNKAGLNIFEINRLESTIGKKLPDFYKEFLLNYPEELVELGAPYNTVSELSLPNTVERLIEVSDFENPPENVLVIGVDGLGNCYYILLENEDTRIYQFDHEDPVFIDVNNEIIDWEQSWDLQYDSLNDLIADLKEKLAE